jgi:hypothetical protein
MIQELSGRLGSKDTQLGVTWDYTLRCLQMTDVHRVVKAADFRPRQLRI